MLEDKRKEIKATKTFLMVQVGTVVLHGARIVSLVIDSRERLCLAQISNSLLKVLITLKGSLRLPKLLTLMSVFGSSKRPSKAVRERFKNLKKNKC